MKTVTISRYLAIHDIHTGQENIKMSEDKTMFISTDNPIFRFKKLNLPTITDAAVRHGIVYRPEETLFNYPAWPSVCSDENGVLYATSSAFGSQHICPFGKYALYISRDQGKTWSLPMVLTDSYVADGHGGILYLGGGRLLASWAYHPADVLYQSYWARITERYADGQQSPMGRVRQAMLEMYPTLPPEKMVGGSFIRISEDYGVTWGKSIRVPIASPHGPCVLPDGTILYLGKEHYAFTAGTFRAYENGFSDTLHANNWKEYIEKLGEMRCGTECGKTPIVAYASTDGGLTWEKRGICEKPDDIDWYDSSEPYAAVLSDGTLFGVIRVEREGDYENDFTLYTTRSADGGYTWSEWVCTHVCGSPGHLLQHSSGALICSIGRRNGSAPGEYAIVSHDGGLTWTEEYEISRGYNSDLGYPASVELADHSILTVYYQHYTDLETGEDDAYPSILCTQWKL